MLPVHVFLSHAPEDNTQVETLAQHLLLLREHGVHAHHRGSVLPGAEEARTREQQADPGHCPRWTGAAGRRPAAPAPRCV